MSIVGVEILKAVIGLQASGPAGFGVHYEVADDAKIDPQNQTVGLRLNDASMKHARAQSESGENHAVAKSLAPQSKAMSKQQQMQQQAEDKYAALFKNRGFSKGMNNSLMGPRPNYRLALASSAPALSKNPLMRIRQRNLLKLRRTFDEIANVKKKTATINPESLPKEELRKMVLTALENGQSSTAVGSIEKTMKLAGLTPSMLGKHATKLKPKKKRLGVVL